jgi:hypothetical protein
MLNKYPMHTVEHARQSLAHLIADHVNNQISVMEYRGIRDMLQNKIKEFEAKEKK